MRQQSGVLLHVPDVATEIYGVFDSYRFAMNVNFSRTGLSQPVKHSEQGRFAGPAFPDENQGFTLNHFEIDVLEDSNIGAELLAHIADTQDGWVHHCFFLDKTNHGYIITKDRVRETSDSRATEISVESDVASWV